MFSVTPFSPMQDLAPPSPSSAPPPAPGPVEAQPWRRDEPLDPRPVESMDYAYLADGRLEPCGRATLLRHLARHPETPGVCVPGGAGLTRPEEVPWLLDEYRREIVRLARREALKAVGWALAGVGFLLVCVLAWDVGVRSLPGLLAVFGMVALGLALHGVRTAGQVTPEVFARARLAHRHWAWAKDQPAHFTWALAVPLGVTYVLTMHDSAIPRAALVKPAVWDGEVWRMLTGPMMHGGVYHLWMNLAALVALGRLVEAHATRFHLPSVFLLSVLGGSAMSVLLTAQTSVGASGGVMGLVGFLWVMARLRPRELPDDFGERMQYAVGATALLGVVGFAFIDNWAHLGGLLAGGGMGWLMLRDGPWEHREGWPVAVAGSLAMVVLWCAMLGAAGAALGVF